MDAHETPFEFTGDQNLLFAGLARKMRLVGWVQVVFGALVFVATLLTLSENTTGLITGVVMVLVGRWTVTASKGFQRVVDTSGSDVGHLMGALGELNKLCGLEYWIFVIGIGLLVAIFGLTLVLALFGALS